MPDRTELERVIDTALAEDLVDGADITTLATVPDRASAVAALVARESGVLAGVDAALAVFRRVVGDRLEVRESMADGSALTPGSAALIVAGPTAGLLTAERTALNILTHLSGIATVTRAWVDAVTGTGARVRDTRKTLPGLRALEKYAVTCGGGVNHRMSLGDAALIKDNHVLAAGSVTAAIEAVRALRPDVVLEVEVDTLDQLDEALAAGATLILLDNFTVEQTAEAVRRTRSEYPGVELEASGGLTLSSAGAVAGTGVDYLSVGALTHSAPILDLGMDLEEF
ncbi:carboxylating nicotinate-nucleotide diphosphorylase [Nakamurella lactea]|uniref:carboxylating nicotinate-nucleotide diphosphorylase n=1 Tax=Nakamurella lactea TaxID=459515 RepID=UPI0004064108|nr:carboxylating nicotinate-nucleotide diphosphorylase [Nakamurella lactea]